MCHKNTTCAVACVRDGRRHVTSGRVCKAKRAAGNAFQCKKRGISTPEVMQLVEFVVEAFPPLHAKTKFSITIRSISLTDSNDRFSQPFVRNI
jgi:hypothetical protein